MPTPARFLCLAALAAAPLLGIARAADNPVVAVVAVDGYADLKKQLGWLGQRVGNPQLAALAESFVMMATQFKGLAGLDVNRPAGVIVTSAPKWRSMRSVWSRVASGSMIVVSPGALRPASRTADFTWADGTGSS